MDSRLIFRPHPCICRWGDEVGDSGAPAGGSASGKLGELGKSGSPLKASRDANGYLRVTGVWIVSLQEKPLGV